MKLLTDKQTDKRRALHNVLIGACEHLYCMVQSIILRYLEPFRRYSNVTVRRTDGWTNRRTDLLIVYAALDYTSNKTEEQFFLFSLGQFTVRRKYKISFHKMETTNVHLCIANTDMKSQSRLISVKNAF